MDKEPAMPRLLEQTCPRCGGPCVREVSEMFDWECYACHLSFRISEDKFVASMPIQRGAKHWGYEPWAMELAKKINSKKK